eukprot:g2614.t1
MASALLVCLALAQQADVARPDPPFVHSKKVALVLFTAPGDVCARCSAFTREGTWDALRSDVGALVSTEKLDISGPWGESVAAKFNVSSSVAPAVAVFLREDGHPAFLCGRAAAPCSTRSAHELRRLLDRRLAAAAASSSIVPGSMDLTAGKLLPRLPAAWWPGRRRRGRAVASAQRPRPRRYLLFDADPGEGFNFRKNMLHRAWALAKALVTADADAAASEGGADAPEWAVVIPKFRDRGSKTQYEPGRFFDIELMRRTYAALGVGALTAGEYVAHFGAAAHASLFFVRADGPSSEKIEASACPTSEADRRSDGYYLCAPDSPPGEASCYYSGVQTTLRRHACFYNGQMHATDPRLVSAIRERVAGAAASEGIDTVSVFLGGFDRIRVAGGAQEERIERFWSERRFVRPARALEAAGYAFLREHFGLPGGAQRPFISAHLRRRDFAEHHAGTYSSADDIAKMLLGLLKRHRDALNGSLTFFIATDAQDEVKAWKQKLQEAIGADAQLCGAQQCGEVEMHTYTRPKSLEPMDAALVEQVIAARGIHFVGTFRSTFSLEIHYERKRLGHEWDEDDSSLMQGGQLAHLCSDKHTRNCEGWIG